MFDNYRQNLINKILDNKLFCDDRGNLYCDDYSNYLSKETGLWQFPDELADLLIYLKDKNIKNFLNIGTFNAITFNFISDYLNTINKTECITIDPINHEKVINNNYIYLSTISETFVGQKYDLVFIDGDHSYVNVKKDYENVGKYSKYCVFHDINDDYIRNSSSCDGGVPRFWDEIKIDKNFIVFDSPKKTHKVMGIGLLIN